MQFFAMEAAGRRELHEEGVEDCDSFRALGTSLAWATGRRAVEEEVGRLGSAAAQLMRVSVLPVPWQQRLQYAAATGVACASWGWLARAPAVGVGICTARQLGRRDLERHRCHDLGTGEARVHVRCS